MRGREAGTRATRLLFIVLLVRGFAPAQQSQPLSCNVAAAATPQIRAEGLTELVGDLLITCTGGVPTPEDRIVPAVDFQVFTEPAVPITSRILAGDFTEALLLIDEPERAKQTICGSPAYPYSNASGAARFASRPQERTGFTINACRTNLLFPFVTSAECAFQYAHGFAFFTDLSTQKLIGSYLSLVLDDNATCTGIVAEGARK